MTNGEGNEAEARIRDARGASIADQGNALSLLELHDELGGFRELVMFVVAGGVRLDAVMIEQLLCLPSILAGDELHFLQRANGAKAEVFEVADRRTHEIQRAARGRFNHRTAGYIGKWKFDGSFPPTLESGIA